MVSRAILQYAAALCLQGELVMPNVWLQLLARFMRSDDDTCVNEATAQLLAYHAGKCRTVQRLQLQKLLQQALD
jgi:hypothetical protein